MADSIGNITVPEVTPTGTFALTTDAGYGLEIPTPVAVHRFGSGNAKIGSKG